ncbi:MAG: TatD family hydrolase [Firmicutes bacterium]|nr:TatD family hydrolase [Bacillota bacterium]
MLFDSHAHLNNADMTEEDREQMVEQIEESIRQGMLDHVMDIGFDPASSEMAAKHAEQYPWCNAAAGCHPHDAKTMDEDQLQKIRDLAAQPKVRAIGEIGLDFHYDLSDRDVQREWFRRQIRLANELKMPICIHAREADQEVMDILVEEGAFSEERRSWFPKRPDLTGFCKGREAGWQAAEGPAAAETAGLTGDARVLLHCFSGSAELGKQYVRMGATLSIAGPVTYKNNKKTVAVVREIPIDFLLVETDSPYLSPVPLRGKPNTPPNVEHTARKVAEIKEMTFEEVAAKTKENAMRFYGID